MGPKKKKKAPSNPARGYATTSVASKPKLVDAAQHSEEQNVAAKETHVVKESTSMVNTNTLPDLQALSPDQLEEHLEMSELQLLVEKYAAKTQRDTSRQISKIYVDRRKLRSETPVLQFQDWFSDDLVAEILNLAEDEIHHDLHKGLSSSKALTEDILTRFWTLQQILTTIGVSKPRINQLLEKIYDITPDQEHASQIWGLTEGLEWLAANCNCEELATYFTETSSEVSDRQSFTRLSSPDSEINQDNTADQLQSLTKQRSSQELTQSSPTITSPVIELSDPSDIDSDIESDELIKKYLSIKCQLYATDPDLVAPVTFKGKSSKTKKGPSSIPKLDNPKLQKLYNILQKIEGDILFDKREADSQWVDMRNTLAREQAARKKYGVNDHSKNMMGKQSNQSHEVKINSSTELLDNKQSQLEDDGFFGEFFSDEQDANPTVLTQPHEDDISIIVRDFGEFSGLNPRRILEEAIRVRDPQAKVTYSLVSPNTYSSRHSVKIIWSKDIKLNSAESTVSTVRYEWKGPALTLTMETLSTPSSEQSEAYVSTATLFILFYASSPEEKSYMRLPPIWRDLYKEFSDLWKQKKDAEDRDTLKALSSIIHRRQERPDISDSRLAIGPKKWTKDKVDHLNVNTTTREGDSSGSRLRAIWEAKSSSESFQRMLLSRSELPMFRFRDEVLSTINQNQVTIICGETGCGKSTQVPAFILENELSQGRSCKIYCTEPRRISAISLAQRVSEELGERKNDLGTIRSLIGYAIRLESATSSSTHLIYATVGIVLRMLESSQELSDITHLIIDEVHERSIDTDFLLIILQSLLPRRPELKVILMSATVDAQKFSTYLNNAPILTVPGRTFPVQTKYLEDALELTHLTQSDTAKFDDSETSEDESQTHEKTNSPSQQLCNYSVAVRDALLRYEEYKINYSLIISLIDKVSSDTSYTNFSKAFLVFLPGIGEIRRLYSLLQNNPAFERDWLIYPLHSSIASEDQQQAFQIPPAGVRKIVLATNIAETGVTIPDITCVIDTGMHREMRFDERRQLSRLVQSFISRANAKQRRGRAGRVQEGLCFHLFTKHRHENLMNTQQTPEMLRLSLQDLVMRTKICKLGNIEKTLLTALDPPTSKNIQRAIDSLIEVDALTPMEELTPLGHQLAKLPLDAHLGKLVLLSGIFNCVDAGITLVAILSSKSPFYMPLDDKARAELAHQKFRKSDSDLLTAYNAYKAWKSACQTPGQSEFQYCRRNYLSSQNLNNIEDLKVQLASSLVDTGLLELPAADRISLNRYRAPRHRTFVTMPPTVDVHVENELLIGALVAASFYPKVLRRDGKGWRTISNNQPISLHPTSVVRLATPIPSAYISYYSIMQSTGSKQPQAQHLTPVFPLPLLLLAGSLGTSMDRSAAFLIHAGVITLDSNRLRFAVPNTISNTSPFYTSRTGVIGSSKIGSGVVWKRTLALKWLRKKVREIVLARLEDPRRALSEPEKAWMDIFIQVFQKGDKKPDRK